MKPGPLAIQLIDVSKRYGGREALSAVSLDVRDGELMAVVGPSGCGKSTLLRSIAGLEDIDSGAVHIAGRPVNHLPPHRRNVAMVFQSYALYPNLSIFENIAFPLRAAGMPGPEVRIRVEDVATRLDLRDHLPRRPRQLSGGERQRVAIARAIVRNPHAFLMDEPLSNLDAELRRRMRAEIVRLQRQLGIATLFVTHDQAEAMSMGDRLTVLKDGTVLQTGTPREVYERPANTFVAGFTGSPGMNLTRTVLAFAGEDGGVRMQGSRLTVPVGDRLYARREEEVIAGIRPEDFQITDGQDYLLAGRVDLVEYHGSETVLTVVAEAGEFMVKAGDRRAFGVDNIVRLQVPPQKIRLFSPRTRNLEGTLSQLMGGQVHLAAPA